MRGARHVPARKWPPCQRCLGRSSSPPRLKQPTMSATVPKHRAPCLVSALEMPQRQGGRGEAWGPVYEIIPERPGCWGHRAGHLAFEAPP